MMIFIQLYQNSIPTINCNECFRSFLFEWCNVLVIIMIIMSFLPISVIYIFHEIKAFILWRKKSERSRIDRAYSMIITNYTQDMIMLVLIIIGYL